MTLLLHRRVDRLTLSLGLIGMTAIAAYHWRARRRDKTFLLTQTTTKPCLSSSDRPGLPSISVLVAAWNEARLIERLIVSFEELDYVNKELIICAGGDDHTYEIAGQYAGQQVVVVKQESGDGKQRALQKCLESAKGDIVILTDADGILIDEAVNRLLKPLVEQDEQAVSGMTQPLPEQMGDPFVLYQWFAEQFAASRSGPYTSLLRGCNAAIERDLLLRLGGFSYPVRIGTDEHLARMLLSRGIRIRFARESEVPNEYPSTFRSYAQQQTRWLRVPMIRSITRRDTQDWKVWLNIAIYLGPMLMLMTSPLLGSPALLAGMLVYIHMLGSRFRIVAFGEAYSGVSFPLRQYPRLMLFLVLDIYIRIAALLQVLRPSARTNW